MSTTEHPIFYWHDGYGDRFRVDVADFDEAAECPHCVPVYSAETVDRLRARVAELESNEPLADTQRAIIEAAERRGYELGRKHEAVRIAELEAERDAAFKMSRCECDSEEACSNLAALHRKVAELEAARGEPVAYLHQVVCGDGEPDQALSFAPDNFPLAGALGYRSLSYVPLYTAPRVDVDAISENEQLRRTLRLRSTCWRSGAWRLT